MGRPRILCVSFSPIIRDARVLRQIDVLAQLGEVTTIGYGDQPPGVGSRHLRIDDANNSLPRHPLGVLKLATRQLRSAELAAPAAQQALRLAAVERARGRPGRGQRRPGPARSPTGWPRGAPVWADMHEWAAEEFSHDRVWRTFVAPLMAAQLRGRTCRAAPP